MYYIILGTVTFSRDEHWKPEASIEKYVATMVCSDYEEASDLAERIIEKHVDMDSYVIPQAFSGRIYNNTDKNVLISHEEYMLPKTKREYRETI